MEDSMTLSQNRNSHEQITY